MNETPKGTIRSLTLSQIDKDARLGVESSLTDGMAATISGFAPVKTGFGLRLHAPLSEAQMDDETRDPGCFLELTFEQAMSLNAELATLLAKQAEKR